MPNKGTHQVAGTLAGSGMALLLSNGQPANDRIAECIGGALGGCLSGRMPDIIDTPNSPNHRSVAHGVAPCTALMGAYASQLESIQSFFRAHADRQEALAKQAHTTVAELWHYFLELLCRLLAGAAAGVLGGYGSHLALDGLTPQSLPLVG
jgi:hypothetical protein